MYMRFAFSQNVTFAQVMCPTALLLVTESGTMLPTQVDVKRRHPDGTVRHALISLRLAEFPATKVRVELVPTEAVQPAVLFDVTLFSARVRGDMNYEARILVDGASVFEQSIQHHARWRTVQFWGAAAPNPHVAPDIGYLAVTGVVPRYEARTIPQDTIHDLANSFADSSNTLGWWGAQSNHGSDGGRPDDNMAPDVRYYTSPWQSDFLSGHST